MLSAVVEPFGSSGVYAIFLFMKSNPNNRRSHRIDQNLNDHLQLLGISVLPTTDQLYTIRTTLKKYKNEKKKNMLVIGFFPHYSYLEFFVVGCFFVFCFFAE